MGKPYQKELEQMPGLYAWAIQQNVDALSNALSALSPYSLVAIGSGGSLTSAQIASSLHQHCVGKLAKSSTPLEAAHSPTLSETAYLFLTAEGKNPDIIGAFHRIARQEPRQLILICGAIGTSLSQQARDYRYVKTIELGIPTGKDGFVATNSLLAFAILLTRAYSQANRMSLHLPLSLARLLDPVRTFSVTLRALEQTSRSALQRDHLLVLYGPTCQAAAMDMESKFSEAALGAIQLADYRNFAHGRHHWLHKRHSSTGIMAYVSDDDKALADRTLELIPRSIPIARISIPYSAFVASISGLSHELYITGIAGQLHGIDPGQPGVPRFGRQIYHLKPRKTWNENSYEGLGSVEAAAIRRKTNHDPQHLVKNGTIEFWKKHLHAYIAQLERTRFCAIVCDYDGTLCEPCQKIDPEIGKRLQGLLSRGWALGIATGRGKSVRDDLREIFQKNYWARILVGYYNAAEIAQLDDDHHPDATATPCPALVPVVRAIERDSHWSSLGELTFRQWQITLKPSNLHDPSLWESARRLAQATGTVLLQSTHSIDFVPPDVSKTNLIRRLEHDLALQGRPDCILRIGDLGRNPGNDADLLASAFGLSVDEVSSDPYTCWNLAPPGCRGVQASLNYLSAIVSRREGFSLDLKKLGLRPLR
jgi:fructoselysine-6-P-deglycase FrlB-like protein